MRELPPFPEPDVRWCAVVLFSRVWEKRQGEQLKRTIPWKEPSAKKALKTYQFSKNLCAVTLSASHFKKRITNIMCRTSQLSDKLPIGNTGLTNFVKGKSRWISNLRVSRYLGEVERFLLNNNLRAAFYKFLNDDRCPDFESGN